MGLEINQTLILSLIWFFIGFGAGLALLRFWNILIVTAVIAVLLPIIIDLTGFSTPLTPDRVVRALVDGISLFAKILGSNPDSGLGFIIGLVVGLLIFVLRIRG